MAPKVKGAVSGGEDHGRSQEPVKQVRIEVPKGGVEGGSLGVDKDGSELQPSSQLDRRSDGDYVIRLDSVAKVYTGGSVATPALQSVSLQILRGEFLAIVGPSGCGKSTLLNIIGALDRPTSGRIFIDGVDLSKLGDGELARLRNGKIGFVFQSFNLIPRMSALWNVEYPLAARNVPVGERRRMAMRTLEMVGLRDKCNRVPPKLSGGEQQRVAVARALATDPAILLGDEPTGNLDSKNSKMLIDLLHKLNKSLGKTIVLITHDMGIAATAQRIIHIKDGLVERVELGRGGYSA
ncbi:MAG: ABC transporter ATP-binding protein [Thaumarchaeota archaeon]|nr:ABC transporter ATP-binding protein [Nitrososphaerota archaeon]